MGFALPRHVYKVNLVFIEPHIANGKQFPVGAERAPKRHIPDLQRTACRTDAPAVEQQRRLRLLAGNHQRIAGFRVRGMCHVVNSRHASHAHSNDGYSYPQSKLSFSYIRALSLLLTFPALLSSGGLPYVAILTAYQNFMEAQWMQRPYEREFLDAVSINVAPPTS